MSSNSTSSTYYPYAIGYPVSNRPPRFNNVPAANNNNNNHIISTQQEVNKRNLCLAIAAVISMFLIVLVVPITYSEIASHRYTNYHPNFVINSMFVSPLNISTNFSGITANWTIGILVNNTNKHVPIDYRKFEVSVFYDAEEYICNTTIAPFHQTSENVTNLIVQPHALLQSLNGSVAASIAKEYANGDISFDVKLKVIFKYINRMYFKKLEDSLKAACMGVKVRFSSNSTEGIMIGNLKRCITKGSWSDFYYDDGGI
ncbi:hypothetical protein ACH5RR_008344 [Cinchona calisaya]|uniref:Late embryogenesis abundant protein LEA-2 subgroup domain-containing protein n=1 Tax=Cinchona calisaya TaxID=153742 RepID=A0ABD3AEX2_9GENT